MFLKEKINWVGVTSTICCQNECESCQRMSMRTHLKLDIRTSCFPSTPIIRLKFFEKRQLFANLPVNFANLPVNSKENFLFEFTGKLAQFTGKFAKSCLFSNNFKRIIGMEGTLEKCGPKFQMKSNDHI